MSLSKRRRNPLPVPRLSFDDIEFYVDIWLDDKLVYLDSFKTEQTISLKLKMSSCLDLRSNKKSNFLSGGQNGGVRAQVHDWPKKRCPEYN